jgi:hypothetical protein
VEYYDVRDADKALKALDGRVVDNMELRAFCRSSLRDHSSEAQKEPSLLTRECEIGGEHAAEPKTPTVATYLSQQSQATSNPARIPFPVVNDIGAGGYHTEREQPVSDRDSSAGFQALHDRRSSAAGLDDLPSVHRGASTDINVIDRSIALEHYGRRSSNHLLFDSTSSRRHQRQFDAEHNRNHSMYDHESEVSDASGLTLAATGTAPHQEMQTYYSTEYYHRTPFEVNPIQPAWVSSPPVPNPISMAMQYHTPSQPLMPPQVYWDASRGWVTFQPPMEPWAMIPPSHCYPQPQPSHPVAEYPFHYATSSTPPQPGTVATRPPSLTHPSSRAPPEGNQLDIRNIELGVDMRTTVMVKNIPNKMTDKELITYINKVCPRRIDFLYLRMDFQNGMAFTVLTMSVDADRVRAGCNVGYAFVNFIEVQDLLQFAQKRLNEKW